MVDEDLNQFKGYADNALKMMVEMKHVHVPKTHIFYKFNIPVTRVEAHSSNGFEGTVVEDGDCDNSAMCQCEECRVGSHEPPGDPELPGEDGKPAQPRHPGSPASVNSETFGRGCVINTVEPSYSLESNRSLRLGDPAGYSGMCWSSGGGPGPPEPSLSGLTGNIGAGRTDGQSDTLKCNHQRYVNLVELFGSAGQPGWNSTVKETGVPIVPPGLADSPENQGELEGFTQTKSDEAVNLDGDHCPHLVRDGCFDGIASTVRRDHSADCENSPIDADLSVGQFQLTTLTMLQMGKIMHYVVTGIFVSTAVLLCTAFVIIFDVVNGIKDFHSEIDKDLDQFKQISNDAWKIMMAAAQKAEDPIHLSVFSSTARFRRGGTYSTGGVGAGAYKGPIRGPTYTSTGGCQCAAQASRCPAGPPGR
ncbi:unnamed protein product [Angiostrongylus costaricensis]|uniref:Col_cuticle_N domain-containing protein n=1 Tax=Angiostrongylus costaricensis TaxID=334426 RepID=A0A0R3PBL7_ANGCS|nr:unnamed protein product [Angiostrongylus costaricensis]